MPPRDERRGDRQKVILPAAVRHVLPDQHAQPVAVIVPPHRLHLDVLAQHVEAEIFHRPDVPDERLVARRGIESIRPIALIEHARVEDRSAVQCQAGVPRRVAPDADVAQRKIALHTVFAQLGGKLVELRMLRRPELRGLHAQDAFAVRERADAPPRKVEIARAVFLGLHHDAHAAVRRVRRDAQPCDIALRHPLHPDRLPDAALRRVPDPAALRLLLAAAIFVRVRPVADGDGQHRRPIRQKFRQLHRKRRVPAEMRPGELPVYINLCLLIDGPEVEQQPLSFAPRLLNLPPVPERLPRQQRPIYAGERRLWGEGDENLAVPMLRLRVRRRDRVVPASI